MRRRVTLLVAVTFLLAGQAPPAHAVGIIGGHVAGACDMELATFPGANLASCSGRATGAGYINIWYGVYSWSMNGADLQMYPTTYDACLDGSAYGYVTIAPVHMEAPDGRVDEHGTFYGAFQWERFAGYVRLVYDYVEIVASDGSYAYDQGLEGALLWQPRNASYLDVAGTCVGPPITPLDVRLNGGEPGYALL